MIFAGKRPRSERSAKPGTSPPGYAGGHVAAGLVFLTLGGYSLLVQVVLLRESFSLFTGNELSVAVQLGLWLCFTAMGGAAGTLMSQRAVGVLLVLLPAAGLWAPVAIRILPLMLVVQVGRDPSLGWAFLCLAAAQFPLNFLAGALFPVACRWFAGANEATSIGRFYMVEALGAAAAGSAFTFLLAGHATGVAVVVWASAGVALVAVVALWRRTRWARVCTVGVGFGLITLCAWGRFPEVLDEHWWRLRHPGEIRVAGAETRYQRIDVGLRDGQHTVYCNGAVTATIEDVDEVAGAHGPTGGGYRTADLYLSFHADPRRVLVIGNAEPGLIARVLEYPIKAATYVLLDPGLLDITCALAGRRVWDDARLTVAPGDGRRYLSETTDAFDLILLDLPPPISAAGNRFFTVQAFQTARGRLADGGLLIFQLPSSACYLAGQTQTLIASIRGALIEAFGPTTALFAAESMVFVAGLQNEHPTLDALAARFAARDVPLALASGRVVEEPARKELVFTALYGPQFNKFRQNQQMAELDETQAPANDDRRPIAYLVNLRRWVREMGAPATLVDSLSKSAEAVVDFLTKAWLLCVPACVVLVVVVGFAARKSVSGVRAALGGAVLTSGAAGMLGELAIVFLYQNTFGQIYRAMGALFAMYMLGLVAGSAVTTGRGRSQRHRALWLVASRGLMLLTCMIALALSAFPYEPALFAGIFIYTFALGMEYPLANRIYREDTGGKRAAGILHSMDHLGAALATFLGGTVVLPLAGAHSTLIAVACVHAVVLAGLVTVLSYQLSVVSRQSWVDN